MKRLSLPRLNASLLLILLIVSLCLNVLPGYLSRADRIEAEPLVTGICRIISDLPLPLLG